MTLPDGCACRPPNLAMGIVAALRPRQWIKNILVFAAPVASLDRVDIDPYSEVFTKAGIAFLAFCAAASSIYLVNDCRDIKADRRHPTKRFRPIAAGTVPVALAYLLAGLSAVSAVWISIAAKPSVTWLIAIYILSQLAYCFGLKNEAVLDICIVASAYVFRAVGGALAAGLPLSQWFLLVMAFGSLFVVAGKRYAELQLASKTGARIRKSLAGYTGTYLTFVWTMAAASAILCYALWAFERTGGSGGWFALSIVPLTIAVLRYAVVIDSGQAGEPEDIVLRDWRLQAQGITWLATVGGAMIVS